MTAPDSSPSPLEISLFGPFTVRVNGLPLPRLRARKGEALLALLALRHGHEVQRTWLAGMLWPDRSASQGLATLRRYLTNLRQALGPEASRLRSPSSQTLWLDLTGATVDVVAFDAAVARGDLAAWEEATRQYRGPLLEGWEEEWLFQEREHREQAYLHALEMLAAAALSGEDLERAERYLRRAAAVDPLRERAQRGLMQVLAVRGDAAGATQVYQELRQRLHQEMNAEPDTETTALFQQLRAEAREKAMRGARCPVPAEKASARRTASEPPLALAANGSEAALGNLPLPLTSFIGREDEIAAIQQRLGAHRLVTLTGAGGCGKTRLALQVAADLMVGGGQATTGPDGPSACPFPDGVWFVDLAPLADPVLVPQSVAAALGVREAPGSSVTQALVGSLKGRQLLLLLDNCEHLVTACARLVETLLQACPRLRVLATSREALGIGGEHPYVVPSLSLPEEGARVTLEGLTQYEAIRLFIERAATVLPTFRVTEESARAVAAICRELDGMPLAIELAAGRLNALSVEEIGARLEDRFRLLARGKRTALPRQQTLRALIDWSYDLLSASERTLLRRLSVFAGGWTLEAAEAVCVGGVPTEGGSRVEEWEVLDLLTSLVEKSLVQYAEPGRHPQRQWEQGRYRLLETVRHYGRDRLCEAGEAEAVRGRHRDWCLAYAERAQLTIHDADQSEWLDRLEAEHDNLRAALAWSGAHGQGEVGLRLGVALWPLWWQRGYWTEGRKHLAGLLALPETAAPTAARAKALAGAGQLASYQGDNGAGRALSEERLAICRELGDKSGAAWSLWELGWVVREQGEHGAARSLFEESLAISREVGEKSGVARSLEELGRLAYDQGEYGAAQALLEESLTIFRERGDKPDTVRLLAFLAEMAQAQGDDEKARALCEEALPLAREVEDKVQLMHMLGAIGHAARQQGDYGRARVLYQESVALRQEVRNTHAIAQSLEDFAGLAGRQQQWERAARLLGAAEAVCADLGTALPVGYAVEYWRTVRGARSALGEEAFAAAWAAGRSMSLDEAVAFALGETREG